tara:strand:+ start:3175 stop:3765 length:591 start_codon:yes stop_codon:yes gene_type:complete
MKPITILFSLLIAVGAGNVHAWGSSATGGNSQSTNTVNGGTNHASGGQGGSSSVGDASAVAHGGAGGSGGTGGAANNSIDVDSSSSHEAAASSAAAVHGGFCQTGASGQITGGGFAVANGDQFCEYLRMADRALLAAQQAKADGDTEMYEYYMMVYHDNMDDADSLVQSTAWSGWFSRVVGHMTPFFAVAGLLILL